MRLSGFITSAERGGRQILLNAKFDIGKGDFLLVVGANGSGKSTFLRIVSGLFSCFHGCIDFKGSEKFQAIDAACHYIGHENAMKLDLTLQENLDFWHYFLRDDECSVKNALEKSGVGHLASFLFRHLSAGQRRKSSLARLLIAYRPFWFLDEPMISLDFSSQTRVLALIEEHRRAGGAVIMTAHPPFSLEGVSSCLEIGKAH